MRTAISTSFDRVYHLTRFEEHINRMAFAPSITPRPSRRGLVQKEFTEVSHDSQTGLLRLQ
jgi:hypothetical protein